ncbi:MAG: universal stress protein, partial [Duncaniella sp.]|nr:universal stress protein [Duncaniella sp.]
AVELAFRIAAVHKSPLTIIHSYIDPAFTSRSAMQLTDSLTFDPSVEASDVVERIEEGKSVCDIAMKQMEKFAADVREKIKNGVLPAVKFSTSVVEGLPEEVVSEFAETHKAMLIVMGTRGAGSRDRELLGSVTAEVLDACKAPVLTVTPDLHTDSLDSLRRVLFFVSPTQSDILALDALYRMFNSVSVEVTLVRLPRGRFSSSAPDAMANLLAYCKDNYPAFRFEVSPLEFDNPVDDFNRISGAHPADLIAMGTKHKNIFSRLFNPTWAHRLLFHANIPLMSIPVQ